MDGLLDYDSTSSDSGDDEVSRDPYPESPPDAAIPSQRRTGSTTPRAATASGPGGGSGGPDGWASAALEAGVVARGVVAASMVKEMVAGMGALGLEEHAAAPAPEPPEEAGWSIKQLKQAIERRGGSWASLVEKAELVERAISLRPAAAEVAAAEAAAKKAAAAEAAGAVAAAKRAAAAEAAANKTVAAEEEGWSIKQLKAAIALGGGSWASLAEGGATITHDPVSFNIYGTPANDNKTAGRNESVTLVQAGLVEKAELVACAVSLRETLPPPPAGRDEGGAVAPQSALSFAVIHS
jgi:hypothetical protein